MIAWLRLIFSPRVHPLTKRIKRELARIAKRQPRAMG